MCVLSRDVIKKYQEEEKLIIEPFHPENLGTASVDLTLGNEFRYFIHHNGPVPVSNTAGAKDYQKFSRVLKLDDGKPYYLGPGQMCLGWSLSSSIFRLSSLTTKFMITGITREKVKLPADLCAIIEGRSRFARLGLSVHITASFIHPGIYNQTVLEIFNASSLTLALFPGTKICQMIFMTMEGHAEYNGIFQGQDL